MTDDLDLDHDLDDDPRLGWTHWRGYDDAERAAHLQRFNARTSFGSMPWSVHQMLTETLAQDESWGRYLLAWPALTHEEEDLVIQAAEESLRIQVLTALILDILTRHDLLRSDDQLEVAAWPPGLVQFAIRVKNRLR